jgi:hypothetical protein
MTGLILFTELKLKGMDDLILPTYWSFVSTSLHRYFISKCAMFWAYFNVFIVGFEA